MTLLGRTFLHADVSATHLVPTMFFFQKKKLFEVAEYVPEYQWSR